MKSRSIFGFVLAMLLVPTGVPAPKAQAYNDFYKVFRKKYVGDESTPEQKKLAAAIKEVKKCNVCHDPRKINGKASKKNRNAYGEALAKLLTKKDKKDLEKIAKALEEVDAQKAPSGDKTFGDFLTSGELPVVIKKK
ncbi:MAG TPA: hypothetical protein ENJ50_04870 [Planctomycetaceae bacterium]|nr:hypothetical protein [Planctomycetaceae bacterium]